MKSPTCLWILTLSLFCAPILAQDAIKKEIVETRLAIQGERRQILRQSLTVTQDEAKAFWPVYDRYAKAMSKVNDRLVKLIRSFSEHQHDLSDRQARAMLRDHLDIERRKVEVRTEFADEFLRVLPAEKAAQFYQLENKMDAMLNMELAREIPLIE